MTFVKNDTLARSIGKRLRAARTCAGMKASIAAERLGYSNATQISLAEKGERIPPLRTLIEYAKLYVVPLDYLCGLIDDPIADAAETNQGVIANAVADAIRGQFSRLASSVAEQASITIAGYNQDRRDLQNICSAAVRARSALKRVRELSPEFDNDWRGTATLVRGLDILTDLASRASERLARERRLRDTVDQELSLDEMNSRARKGIVQLTFTD
ncbi:hypothetical protein ASE98_14315 [Pseudomonas sp. Leaf48]|jgi:transcriptional regulator with XRE-family HTH domain|uniref:helix-turn-helix domain-containing protein n=1 Tax=unclassified Pseudomonas TaxID=196821 RepID=UPI00072604C1|nr:MULTISPECIES: helix-turn-helix transcriptional regulator [unclassified Pseudomonas]KQN40096.1 hypothetical protein ASE98_14315 [Pseudomonas sp. Leaf48]